MTIFHSDISRQKTLGLIGAMIAVIVVFAGLLLASTDEEKSTKTHSLFNAFGVVWEMKKIEWRKAEGLYALKFEAHPVRGSGKLPGSEVEVANAFCGAVLTSLPKDAPVGHRNEVFRVRALLPALERDGQIPDVIANIVDGRCEAHVDAGRFMLSYPGLAPDWVLFEWKADNADLDGFKVVFRRTADAPLNSLDLALACRAAFFDLPQILGEHLEAFRRLETIRIAAEAGAGSGLFRASRALTWDVPVASEECGQAAEVKL